MGGRTGTLVPVRWWAAGRRSALAVALVLVLGGLALPVSAAAAAPAGAARSGTVGPTARVEPEPVFVLPLAPPPLTLTPFTPPPSRYGAGHRGVDLAATVGALVLAAGAGTVVFAGMLAGRGVVSVQHGGGLRTTYEPVTALVRAGDPVARGQPIGTVQPGHPGCAPATCVHWGARLPDRVYLDPMSLLGPWRVRLWPWAGR